MSGALLSSRQREILEEMARGPVLCLTLDDSNPMVFAHRRYVLGGRPVDGRSVDGLTRRELVAPSTRACLFRGWITLELTDAGWVALGATYTVSGAPDASVDDQGASPAHDAAGDGVMNEHEHPEMCGRIEHLMQARPVDGQMLVMCGAPGCMCGTFWMVLEGRTAAVRCHECHATLVTWTLVDDDGIRRAGMG